jgi:hypothetical protein
MNNFLKKFFGGWPGAKNNDLAVTTEIDPTQRFLDMRFFEQTRMIRALLVLQRNYTRVFLDGAVSDRVAKSFMVTNCTLVMKHLNVLKSAQDSITAGKMLFAYENGMTEEFQMLEQQYKFYCSAIEILAEVINRSAELVNGCDEMNVAYSLKQFLDEAIAKIDGAAMTVIDVVEVKE